MQTVVDLAATTSILAACGAMGVSRAAWYRRAVSGSASQDAPRLHPRALAANERGEVLTALTSKPYIDCSPAAAHAALLEQGHYLCSVSTMYRILRSARAVRERRAQRRHPKYEAPQLLATRANEVWSWDITKLLGTRKWQYFHLYVMLDIFSRHVIGWLVAEHESGALANALIKECCHRQGIGPGSLTIQSDRGPAMTSRPVVSLLHTLDVHKTVSRPHVSNDNPFIEAHFKTMKYQPCFPRRFGSIQDARATLVQFFNWYNTQHRHSGIAYLTPETVHCGRADIVQQQRSATLLEAFDRHPERFVRGRPKPPPLPTAVWINPPQAKPTAVAGVPHLCGSF